MAWPFSGNINGTVDSQSQSLPMLLDSFTLVNKTAGTIGVNVYKITVGGSNVSIIPLNTQLTSGQMYQGDNEVVFLATETIRVQSSGSCDYDFKMNNIQAEFENGKL